MAVVKARRYGGRSVYRRRGTFPLSSTCCPGVGSCHAPIPFRHPFAQSELGPDRALALRMSDLEVLREVDPSTGMANPPQRRAVYKSALEVRDKPGWPCWNRSHWLQGKRIFYFLSFGFLRFFFSGGDCSGSWFLWDFGSLGLWRWFLFLVLSLQNGSAIF